MRRDMMYAILWDEERELPFVSNPPVGCRCAVDDGTVIDGVLFYARTDDGRLLPYIATERDYSELAQGDDIVTASVTPDGCGHPAKLKFYFGDRCLIALNPMDYKI